MLCGWTFEPRDGFVQLRPSDAPGAGVIRYTERVRPGPPLLELVAAHLARFSRLELVQAHAVEELTTHEGEAAALITLSCNLAGAPVQLTLGYVWVDEFCSETAALSFLPAMHARFVAAARELVLGDRHLMRERRRRYPHRAPPGWRAATRESPLNLIWLPPDPDADGSRLYVAAAMPLSQSEPADATLACHLASGLRILRHGELACPPLAPGLDGRVWRLEAELPDGTAMVRSLAALHDERFSYPLHLDSPAARSDANAAHFAAVLASVQPLAPRPLRRQRHEGATALFGWLTL